MKKIYLIVLAAITVFAVIFGTAYHMYGFFGNKNVSGEVVDVSYDFEDIEKIDVDAGLIDMNIIAGDKFSVSFSGYKELLPEIKEDNKTLVVYQKTADNNGVNLFKPQKRNMHGVDNVLTIVVPAGVELDEIDFDCSLGDADITKVSAKKMDIECALGDIDLIELTVDELVLNADMGDVSLKNIDVKDINAKLAMGNFDAKLVKDISEYGFDLDVSMGKCKVGGQTVSNKYSNSGSGGTISVSCDMGDVDIK